MSVACVVYEQGGRRHRKLELEEARVATASGLVWLDLEEPTPEERAAASSQFGLDLAVLERAGRPTLEPLGDNLLLVVRTASYVAHERVELGDLTVVAGLGFLVTIRRGAGVSTADAQARAQAAGELSGTDAAPALRAILESVFDDWEHAVGGLYEDIDRLEELIFSPNRMYRADRISTLMRALLRVHRAIAPLHAALRIPARAAETAIADLALDLQAFSDRAERLLADLQYLTEHLSIALQMHDTRAAARLAQVSVRQAELATHENQQMRKIAAWAAILAVPTLIVGIYGMHFRDMPAPDWSFGYPLALGVMAALCLGLYRWFRRIDWL